MNFASKLSFLWLVHPLCSLGYRFVPSTGRPTKKLTPTHKKARPNTKTPSLTALKCAL